MSDTDEVVAYEDLDGAWRRSRSIDPQAAMPRTSLNDAFMRADTVGRGYPLTSHQLNHADNRLRFGGLLDPNGLPETVRTKPGLSTLVIGDGRAG